MRESRRPGFDEQLTVGALRAAQNGMSCEQRDAMARLLATSANSLRRNIYTGEYASSLLDTLSHDGLCRVPLDITPKICADVINYYRQTPCYASHVPAYSDGVAQLPEEVAQKSNYGSYTLAQSVMAPHLLELALNPTVLDLVGGYLTCLPTLYSINTFWTFPRPNVGLTHDYHRDEDDYRFIAVFIYWTPVEEGEGEFYFFRGSHNYAEINERLARKRASLSPGHVLWGVKDADDYRKLNGGNGYGSQEIYRTLFGNDTLCVSGAAGTTVAADTFGIHRGSLPKTRPRLCTWFRYGLYANDAYRIDKTTPVSFDSVRRRVPSDETTRYVTRLILT